MAGSVKSLRAAEASHVRGPRECAEGLASESAWFSLAPPALTFSNCAPFFFLTKCTEMFRKTFTINSPPPPPHPLHMTPLLCHSGINYSICMCQNTTMFRQQSLFLSKTNTLRPMIGRSKVHNDSKNKHFKEECVKVQ